MRKNFITLILLVQLGCGNNDNGHKDSHNFQRNDKGNNYENQKLALNCLRNKTDFLENRPSSIKKVVSTIGHASIECKASIEDIEKLSLEIIQKHGDL